MFGNPLELVCTPKNNYTIPQIFIELCSIIRLKGFNFPGLFRLEGKRDEVQNEIDKICRGVHPNLKDYGIPLIGSLLKAFIRLLPSPLIPYEINGLLLQIKDEYQNEVLRIKIGEIFYNLIPKENYHFLHYLCLFLNEAIKNEEENLLSPKSVGILFGPLIYKYNVTDLNLLGKVNELNSIFGFTVQFCSFVFSPQSHTPLDQNILKIYCYSKQNKKLSSDSNFVDLAVPREIQEMELKLRKANQKRQGKDWKKLSKESKSSILCNIL